MMDAAPADIAPAAFAIFFLLLMIPIVIIGIAQLVCLVMVIAKMFQHGETGIGIACAALSLCTGIGALIAFVYGWIKSSEWGLKKVMVAWTLCLAVNLVLAVVAVVVSAFVGAASIQQAPQMQNVEVVEPQ